MRHLSLVVAAVLSVVVGAFACTARAWNADGHMIIASIAYEQLTEEQRRQMLATLRGNAVLFKMLTDALPADAPEKDRDRYIFMLAATWPDMIRGADSPMRTQHRSSWHYINFPLAWDGVVRKEPDANWKAGQEPRNILEAIVRCEHELKAIWVSAEDRAILLCWTLHLVGDLHQPLHAVALFADRYPTGDQGGNRVIVLDGTRKTKLHALWDDLLGRSQSPSVASERAAVLLRDAKFSLEMLAPELERITYREWADESRALASRLVYRDGAFPGADADATENNPAPLPGGYLDAALAAADRRVVLAGYRLASVLVAVTPALPQLLDAATMVSPGNYTMNNFVFRSGEVLPELRMHYRTVGLPIRDANGVVRNAVLILHGTTGSSTQFFRPEFSGSLFGPGQVLDATRYYIIIPDDIGHGGSSKPSDGMHAKFPRYGYLDMIEAEFRLVSEGLGIPHLRLVMGTSMGGMHTWLWGELHPEFMDALMPMASLPGPIAGRNRVWRTIISEGIRTDPEWMNGEYSAQPRSLRLALQMLYFMGSNPRLRYEEAPTGADADRVLAAYVEKGMQTMDANDVLYAIESSRDYDPAPALESIIAPLVAINTTDDLINPPDLGILEREIKRVKRGRAIVIPESEKTRGHGSHTVAALWVEHLEALLKETERP